MKRAIKMHIDNMDFVPALKHKDTFVKPLVDEKDSPHVKVLFIKVLPGGEIVPHTHDQVEVFYILQGEGSGLLNGEHYTFKEGSCIYVPAFCEHGLRNDGEKDLYLLANFHKYEY